MNMNRPDMTENVKYKDYTNESLQMDSNPVTMKASKTPAIESSDQTQKKVPQVSGNIFSFSPGLICKKACIFFRH